jgi:hypothetical protein
MLDIEVVDNEETETLQRWLEPLLKLVGAEVLITDCYLSGYTGPRFSPKLVQAFSPKLVQSFSPKVVHSFSAKGVHEPIGAAPPTRAYSRALKCREEERCPQTGRRPWTYERY